MERLADQWPSVARLSLGVCFPHLGMVTKPAMPHLRVHRLPTPIPRPRGQLWSMTALTLRRRREPQLLGSRVAGRTTPSHASLMTPSNQELKQRPRRWAAHPAPLRPARSVSGNSTPSDRVGTGRTSQTWSGRSSRSCIETRITLSQAGCQHRRSCGLVGPAAASRMRSVCMVVLLQSRSDWDSGLARRKACLLDNNGFTCTESTTI
mmetsp:Transcript_28775/g.66435  ORF Transcript_28775/g.66435 Transcript_28775/m.66435 type:complete len:207 (-) Transcript_28775:227-847(-)